MSEKTLVREANELLRQLNWEVLDGNINIAKLPRAVELVCNFAEKVTAEGKQITPKVTDGEPSSAPPDVNVLLKEIEQNGQMFIDGKALILRQRNDIAHLKALLRCDPEETIDDGFGGVWSRTCPTCGLGTMRVNSPGEVQCDYCDPISGAAQEVSPEHILRNLLAVIHRDGGHYAAEHGLEKAGEDAQALVLKERVEEVSPPSPEIQKELKCQQ